MLSAEESEQIEQELRTFEENTSNAIVVVVVDDLYDMEIEQYADELGEAWGVGTAKHDNGIVFLIKPFGEGERKVTIQVGRGLEGIIPDLVCKDIIDREFIPNMKAGNPRNAIEQSLKILKELAQKEYSFKQYHTQDGGSIAGGIFAVIVIMLVIYALIKKGEGGPKGGKEGTTGVDSGEAAMAVATEVVTVAEAPQEGLVALVEVVLVAVVPVVVGKKKPDKPA